MTNQCHEANRRPPDHTAELTRLRARLYSPELSPLEAASMLAALELLRGHEQGIFEFCGNPYCISLLTLCLGAPFEVTHADEDPEETCECYCHDD